MGQPGNVRVAEVKPRVIYGIGGSSLLAKMFRNLFSSQPADRPTIEKWQHQLQGALNSGDIASLHQDTLTVATAKGTVSVSVSMLNNLLGVADSAVPDYSFGFDPYILAMIDLLLPDDGVLYDIGSSWGIFSVATAVRQGFHGAIHAFEPMVRAADDQARIRDALPLECEYHLHRFAASDHEGSEKLIYDTWLGGTHLRHDDREETGAFEIVTLRPIDSLGLPPPTLVKMDVEEHEAQVIRGAYETIKAGRPSIIFENWLRTVDEIAHAFEPFLLLGGLGYSFYCPAWLTADGRLSYRPDQRLATQKFCLIPFAAEERLKMSPGMNFLAVPDDGVLKGWDTLGPASRDGWPFAR